MFPTPALTLLVCLALAPHPAAAVNAPPAAGWVVRASFAVGTGPAELAPEVSAQENGLALSDLGLAPDGRAFAADAGAGRLLVLSPGGSVECDLPFPPGIPRRGDLPPAARPAPRFFTVAFSASTGEAYLVDVASGEVHVYSKGWTRLRGFSVADVAVTPKSLVALRNGEFRLHDPGKGKVFLFSAEGALLGATRAGRPSLVAVPAVNPVAFARDLVGFGEGTAEKAGLVVMDSYGVEPSRPLGSIPCAREGSDRHLIPHPGDPKRFAFVESGPRPGDPLRVTLCRFVPVRKRALKLETTAPLAIDPPPQDDLVLFHPYRLTATGELVTFGRPAGGACVQILARALPWPK